MSEDIARIRWTRKTYLRSISNQENHILDLISNYSADQQNELNLKAKKITYKNFGQFKNRWIRQWTRPDFRT